METALSAWAPGVLNTLNETLSMTYTSTVCVSDGCPLPYLCCRTHLCLCESVCMCVCVCVCVCVCEREREREKERERERKFVCLFLSRGTRNEIRSPQIQAS